MHELPPPNKQVPPFPFHHLPNPPRKRAATMGSSKNALLAGLLSVFVGGVYVYTYTKMSKVRGR